MHTINNVIHLVLQDRSKMSSIDQTVVQSFVLIYSNYLQQLNTVLTTLTITDIYIQSGLDIAELIARQTVAVDIPAALFDGTYSKYTIINTRTKPTMYSNVLPLFPNRDIEFKSCTCMI